MKRQTPAGPTPATCWHGSSPASTFHSRCTSCWRRFLRTSSPLACRVFHRIRSACSWQTEGLSKLVLLGVNDAPISECIWRGAPVYVRSRCAKQFWDVRGLVEPGSESNATQANTRITTRTRQAVWGYVSHAQPDPTSRWSGFRVGTSARYQKETVCFSLSERSTRTASACSIASYRRAYMGRQRQLAATGCRPPSCPLGNANGLVVHLVPILDNLLLRCLKA